MSEPVYETAFQLLKLGDPSSIEKGIALLKNEVDSRPSDSKALFEYAGAFDFLGREAEALPHYQKALSEGFEKLPPDDQPRIFVQLGSTLRNLKRFTESREVLQLGLSHFPDIQALKAFLALTEFSARNQEQAAKLLFELVLKGGDSSIKDYSRALGWYVERLSTFP